MCTEEVVSVPQETTPEAVEASAEPTFPCFVQSKHCAGRNFKATELYVPRVLWLYRVMHNTDVDPSQPLTDDEVIRHARCGYHCSGPLALAYNKKEGIAGMHPLSNTLNLMARWKENLQRKAKKRQERDMVREFKWAQGEVRPTFMPKNYGSYKNDVGGKRKKVDGKKKGKKKH